MTCGRLRPQQTEALPTGRRTFTLDRLIARLAHDAGIDAALLPVGVRVRRAGDIGFAFNYNAHPARFEPPKHAQLIISNGTMPPAGVAIWRAVDANQ